MSDNKCTAFAMLHEGRRLGWKISLGDYSDRSDRSHSSIYFGHGPESPPRTECVVERKTFDDWSEAERWCATFPAHPAEGGKPPWAGLMSILGELAEGENAETEEKRIADLEKQVAQLQTDLLALAGIYADARALAGLYFFADEQALRNQTLPGLTPADFSALDAARDASNKLDDADVVALLRRATVEVAGIKGKCAGGTLPKASTSAKHPS